jgi:hypothetical protein
MWEVEGKCLVILWDGHRSQHLGVVWEDDIKIDHRKVGWGGMEWIDLAQVASLVNAVANPCASIDRGAFLD